MAVDVNPALDAAIQRIKAMPDRPSMLPKFDAWNRRRIELMRDYGLSATQASIQADREIMLGEPAYTAPEADILGND